MGLEELRKKRIIVSTNMSQDLSDMKDIADESKRVVNVIHNTEKILDDIDIRFEQTTSLNNNDFTFLFFATMLQTLRWFLLPELNLPKMDKLTPSVNKGERLAANERNHIGGIYDGKKSGAEYELEELAKYKDKHRDIVLKSKEEFYEKHNKYRSWIEILSQPVPYDAMNALDKKVIPNIAGLNKKNLNGLYNNIYGKNHHVATLGHDPVLGWFFGTANIMTNTISFVDFQSYDVIQGHKVKSLGEFKRSNELQFSDQTIDYMKPRSLITILQECMLSTEEDYKRIVAAVVREAIHLSSDKYCVEGLPIPILASINPKRSQELIEQGWNSLEFKKLLTDDLKQIGVSAGLAWLINLIIESIYLFCFKTNDNFDIRRIKIKKIISASEIMASSSNVLYVALTKNMAKLDIGGLAVTMFTLLQSQDFIKKMKQEYIRNKMEDLVIENSSKEVF
ncbi:hypothetical protein AALC16_15425 [Lachnospiraceae bacterium 29-91]